MGLFSLLIYLVVLIIVFALVWWILTQVTLPAPIAGFVRIIVVAIFALILIFLLLSAVGVAPSLQLR